MFLIFTNIYWNFRLIYFRITNIHMIFLDIIRWYLLKINGNTAVWRDDHIWIFASETFLLIMSSIKSVKRTSKHWCLNRKKQLDLDFIPIPIVAAYLLRSVYLHLYVWWNKIWVIFTIVKATKRLQRRPPSNTHIPKKIQRNILLNYYYFNFFFFFTLVLWFGLKRIFFITLTKLRLLKNFELFKTVLNSFYIIKFNFTLGY